MTMMIPYGVIGWERVKLLLIGAKELKLILLMLTQVQLLLRLKFCDAVCLLCVGICRITSSPRLPGHWLRVGISAPCKPHAFHCALQTGKQQQQKKICAVFWCQQIYVVILAFIVSLPTLCVYFVVARKLNNNPLNGLTNFSFDGIKGVSVL